MRTKEVANVTECARYTNKHNGLAFNFSPEDGAKYKMPYTRNCHVLGCPEVVANSSTFEEDLAFDYYSAFGNLNATKNSTCIESTGVFNILADRLNYSDSALGCQAINAELADIVTETRTKHLSQYIESTLDGWYKVAYVGLDDIDQEGTFITAQGNSLSSCSRYRAWAPGKHLHSAFGSDTGCVNLNSFFKCYI
nr:unnamed protein product [Callosobruchus analis]